MEHSSRVTQKVQVSQNEVNYLTIVAANAYKKRLVKARKTERQNRKKNRK